MQMERSGKLLVLALLLGLAWLFHRIMAGAALAPADLTIGNGPDPRSLDPAMTSAIADGRVLSGLFEGLVTAHPRSLQPVPGLASSWEVSEDHRRYVFHLRPGLCWSDGHPLPAPDLRWSFLRFLDPRTAGRYSDLLYPVVGAERFNRTGEGREQVGFSAPNDATLVVELRRATPYFLDILTLFPLYPVPRHAVEAHGAAWVKPGHFVSNGAFRLVEWRLRDRLRLEKNPHYWNAAAVTLQSLDFLCVESASTLLNLYLSGTADIITDVPAAAVPALLERFGPRGSGEFHPELRLGTFFLRLNVTRAPFTNPLIRRALALAVDRDAIVGDILRAGELPALSFVPPGVRCGDTTYRPPRTLSLDVEESRRLLEAGLRQEGLTALPIFEVLYSPDVGDQAICEFLQQRWSQLGIRCRLVNLDHKSILAALKSLDYTVARSSWLGDYNDPSTFLDQYRSGSPNNRTGWSRPDYDRLVDDLAGAASSDQARARTFAAAEEILIRDAPIVPIYHYVSRSLVKPHVTGYCRNILDWNPPRFLGRRSR